MAGGRVINWLKEQFKKIPVVKRLCLRFEGNQVILGSFFVILCPARFHGLNACTATFSSMVAVQNVHVFQIYVKLFQQIN